MTRHQRQKALSALRQLRGCRRCLVAAMDNEANRALATIELNFVERRIRALLAEPSVEFSTATPGGTQ